MKNHIVFKFLAILLCAASLMGAVGSAVGMFAMTEMGLYKKDPAVLYAEEQEHNALNYAINVAEIYASRTLGGAGSDLANSFYSEPWRSDVFAYDRIGYVIKDAQGNALQSMELSDAYPTVNAYSFELNYPYIRVLSETPASEYYQMETPVLKEGVTTQVGDNYVYNAIPENGAEVYFIDVAYSDGSTEGIGSPGEPLGVIFTHDGIVEFQSATDNLFSNTESGEIMISITFQTRDNQCIYEASSPDGVLESYSWGEDSGTYMTMRSLEEEVMTFDAIPPEGCCVSRISVSYADGFSESAGGAPDIGYLDYDEEGRVRFTANSSGMLTYVDLPVTHIVFCDENGELVYEARDPEGTGCFYLKGENLIFLSGAQAQMEELTFTIIPMETTETDTEGSQTPFLVGAQSNLGIYEEPSRDAQLMDVLKQNSIVEVVSVQEDAEGQWGQIVGGWIQLAGTIRVEMPVTEDVPDETIVPTVEATEVPTIPETANATEETVAVETTPYETPLTDSTEPTTAAAVQAAAEAVDCEIYEYYDDTAGERMVVEYVYETMPGYTVEVSLAANALRNEAEWTLLNILYSFQKELPYVLGISLLLFAILAVYLCCAAGKKPGTTEICAGGLNRIPLDLYAGLTVGGVAGSFVAGVEGTQYLLRSDIGIGLLCALLCAAAASLLIVGFCFACAAQFKTPGGYWWRYSLCGMLLRLIAKCCRLLLKFAEWLDAKWDSKLWPGLVKLCKGIFQVLEVLLKQLWKWVLLIFGLLRTGMGWLGKKLNRFFSLLPVTWQWLLVGVILIFVSMTLRSDPGFWSLASWCLCFGIVIYGAYCFGCLLESAKRMSKGDLDEKVDDRLLIGSFKDFAGELNSLADVAVVAAQKQLKSERMKTELITNVSHDIKTPLTSIINYVDLLQKPHTAEDQEKYLEVLDRQSQRLKKLIDDLMEMSKASTGNLSVDITVVDAGEAVNQALGEFADKLDKAQLYPVFRQPEEQVRMMADGRLVWRVMSNLLSNAVKYALPGTRLYVDMQKLDSKVIISMKNISREELNVNADELLERFVRGDASRNTEGSGLGLNIAQSLMELQKGQLQILVDGDLFKVTLVFPGVE